MGNPETTTALGKSLQHGQYLTNTSGCEMQSFRKDVVENNSLEDIFRSFKIRSNIFGSLKKYI